MSRQLHQRASRRRQIAALAGVGTRGGGWRRGRLRGQRVGRPVSLPGRAEVLLASGPLDGGRLPADTGRAAAEPGRPRGDRLTTPKDS